MGKERIISSLPELTKLLETLRHLRSDQGCPWDRKQSLADMCRYLLDESYELQDAIDDNDTPEIIAELGDVLFLVLSCNLILEAQDQSTLEKVARGAREKIIRRHPHVFGDQHADNVKESLQHWQDIKSAEARQRGESQPTLLQNIPRSLPALRRAKTVQEKVASVGFEWETADGVFDKLLEETEELREVLPKSDPKRIEDEVGDLLFSVINLGRYLGIDPERALHSTIHKFTKRFTHVEKALRDKQCTLEEATLTEMDQLWEEAKKHESNR